MYTPKDKAVIKKIKFSYIILANQKSHLKENPDYVIFKTALIHNKVL